MAYDPKTERPEHFGLAKPKHGIISVTPDESRGLVYVSTCSDDRPIDHTHFMVYDQKKKYRLATWNTRTRSSWSTTKPGVSPGPRGQSPATPDAKKLERLNTTIDSKARCRR